MAHTAIQFAKWFRWAPSDWESLINRDAALVTALFRLHLILQVEQHLIRESGQHADVGVGPAALRTNRPGTAPLRRRERVFAEQSSGPHWTLRELGSLQHTRSLFGSRSEGTYPCVIASATQAARLSKAWCDIL
jgi:hypothetical protein